MLEQLNDTYKKMEPSCQILFRAPKEAPGKSDAGPAVEDRTKEDTPDSENAILCRQCQRIITRHDERMDFNGAFRHTFANPHGIVFEIGCFRSAAGCTQIGPLSDEFSWFRGFSWRIAVCSSCLTHLGWLYVSTTRMSFFGLILDRLMLPP